MNLHRERIPTRNHRGAPSEDAGAGLLGKLQQTEGAFAEHHKTNPGSGQSMGCGLLGRCVIERVRASLRQPGWTFASLGSDTGGSVRFPARRTISPGIKPTWGQVSRHGVYPNSPSMDHVGPMARSVGDVAIVLEAMAGADPLDRAQAIWAFPVLSAKSPQEHRSAARSASIRRLRSTAPPMRSPPRCVGRWPRRAEIGLKIEEVSLPDPAQVTEDWFPMSGVEMAPRIKTCSMTTGTTMVRRSPID